MTRTRVTAICETLSWRASWPDTVLLISLLACSIWSRAGLAADEAPRCDLISIGISQPCGRGALSPLDRLEEIQALRDRIGR